MAYAGAMTELPSKPPPPGSPEGDPPPAAPAPIELRPIGVVRSAFRTKLGVPIQTAGAPDVPARVDVLEPFVPGLRDLEGFEYEAAQRIPGVGEEGECMWIFTPEKAGA